MDRYKMLPSYHYEENNDGVINHPATDKVRTCTIYGNHGRNLIPFPYVGKAGTQNGVTITIDSVGVITLNGTATASVYFGLLTVTQAIKKPGKYTISGAPGIAGVSVQCKVDGAWTGASVDTGNGATFTVTQQIDQITVQINKGTVCDSVVVKPMLEEGESVTPFEPWCGVGDKTKNILPYPYADTTKTINGITFTDNGDGSVTVNGTATASISFHLTLYESFVKINKKLFICGCPRGGSASSYSVVTALYKTVDGKPQYVSSVKDVGNGAFLDCTQYDFTATEIRIVVATGTVCDNLVFKPLLVDLNTQNLIPYPYARTTQTLNGITFTDNKDGTITINGTATANAWYPISTRSASTIYATKGKYYLSGCPSGGSGSTYFLNGSAQNNTTLVAEFRDVGSGKIQDLSAYDFTTISVNINVRKGVTVNNLTFRPLLVNMDSVSSYEPYGYKIPVANDTRENLLNVDDFEATQTNSYFANKSISLTDSNMSTYLPYLDEMKGKSVVCSYDLDNENFHPELIIFYNVEVDGTKKFIELSKKYNFTATLPQETPIRLEVRARSGSADLNGTTVKFSNISLKFADVKPEITNIYLPKQIMQGETETFKEPFKLSKANKLSVETADKPSAVKYTYYTY